MKPMNNLYFAMFLIMSIIFYLVGLFFLYFFSDYSFDYNFVDFNSLNFLVAVKLDWVTFMFCSFVFFIASMVVKYSEEYMYDDSNLKRFMVLLMVFVFSMMFMIISSNLISILLGWDGLGLVSYALVTYYQNTKSYVAGMLTLLMNRLGDASLLSSISFMSNMGSWNFFNYLNICWNKKISLIIVIFIIIAAMTKSAQMPFSSWLPAAMAAPTPISSLVHSSTLVTAGVYLLFRFSPMFSAKMMEILLYLSLLTMFVAGLAANFEFDLKKIIALSTLSQLGMMVVILCLGNQDLAFFHLLIHSSFKALLFMCAGAIIHNIADMQDIRLMGGIVQLMPMNCVCLNISNFALCGLPFLSGFYSKDLIAESLSQMSLMNIIVFVTFFISVGLTVSYTMRVASYLLYNEPNFLCLVFMSDKNNKIMLKGMFGLVLLVIVKGSLLMWLLFPTPVFTVLPSSMKKLVMFMIFIGVIMGMDMSELNHFDVLKALALYKPVGFFARLWNMPILSTFGLNSYLLKFGKNLYIKIDQRWMEFYGTSKICLIIKILGRFLQKITFGHLKTILLLFLILLLFMLIYSL